MAGRYPIPFGGGDEQARQNIRSHEWLFNGESTTCRVCGVSIDDVAAEYRCGDDVPWSDRLEAFFFTFGHACNLRHCFVKVMHFNERSAREWFLARRKRAGHADPKARWSSVYDERQWDIMSERYAGNWPSIEVPVTMPALAWGPDL